MTGSSSYDKGLQVPIKFTLMATIMVYKKSIELEQGTKDLIREEKLNDCSAQRTRLSSHCLPKALMAGCKYSGDMLTFTFSSRLWYNKSFRNRLPLKKLSSDEVAQLDTFQSATIQFLLDVYVLFHLKPLFH